MTESKVVTASEAVGNWVHRGDCVSLGGFTINRNPMALTHEIIRQNIGDIHVVLHSGSQALDLLIGAGLVGMLEIAYGANGRLANTCIRFAKAAEEGRIPVEDYSNYQMTLRFMAGAMGVPYLPTFSSLGTDIISRWGFDSAFRSQKPRLPSKKLIVAEDPFSDDGKRVVLVPAINPDVALIHAQKASADGCVRIEGLSFADIEQARASKHVIVTCEELVSPQKLRREPWRNSLPHVTVDAVVHQPYGAHPTACYLCYDYDSQHLTEYAGIAENDGRFLEYLETHIRKTKNFDDYLQLIGQERLDSIKASPVLGYAKRRPVE